MYLICFRLEFGMPLKHVFKNNDIPARLLVGINNIGLPISIVKDLD